MSDAVRLPAWVDGELVAPGQPALAADDPGVLHGHAAYDTLRCTDGAPRRAAAHLARLRAACGELGIPWPAHDLAAALEDLARAAQEPDLLLRITVTAGGAVAITARRPEAPPTGPVTVVLSRYARAAGDPLARLKHASRLDLHLALAEARAQGAFEALVATPEGEVLEGTRSSVFALLDGRAVTPAVERGCLPGITRAELLEGPFRGGAPAREGVLTRGSLAEAEEVWLAGTGVGLVQVGRIPGLREWNGAS